MKEELKPCPFCGGEVKIKERSDSFHTGLSMRMRGQNEILFDKMS